MPTPADSYTDQTIRTVEITFDIIETIQRREKIGVTELANELDHSKSTIHSHLQTLKGQKMIVQEDDGYRLSLQLLDMARGIRDLIGNYQVIRNEVDTLADETGETAQFGVEENGKITYMYKSTGDNAVETASRVGTQQPIYSTSIGKTILACVPSTQTTELIREIELTPQTPHTITDPIELYDELDRIAERGYGIDDEENLQGIRCVAAPVQNDEMVLGAVSVTGPTSRATDERLHGEYANSARQAANIIEVNTKFS